MQTPPAFLTTPQLIKGEEIFRPANDSRKGELIVWGSALVMGIGLGIYYFATQKIQCLTSGMLFLFLSVGALISFGIWVDTRTSINVNSIRLIYKSPFKELNLDWDQVLQVRATQARRLWRVIIASADNHFRLRVSSSASEEDDTTNLLALPDGDRLVQIILGMADLTHPNQEEDEWVSTSKSSNVSRDK